MTWALLPYGSFTTADDPDRRRVGVRLDGPRAGRVLDLTAASRLLAPEHAALFSGGTLDHFLAGGPASWRAVREVLLGAWDEVGDDVTVANADVALQLPFAVGDYVDFYASEHHATNLGRLFRPGGDPLTPNWKHLPIGYHGRSGTVVVSGTPITRPAGQLRSSDGDVSVAPTDRLDIEAEIGFIVGGHSELGRPIPVSDFADHVFGLCLVNDWSARDIQAWEYVPLGPFLGKSFATSVSPWVTPLGALAHARLAPPPRDPAVQAYLDDAAHPWGFDITLEVRLNGETISRPPLASMYWTGAQMLAHMTLNGASTRSGDLFASGTVSGPDPHQWGSLIELTHGGRAPLTLDDGSARTFLADGDEVIISATVPTPDGNGAASLGEVRGTIIGR